MSQNQPKKKPLTRKNSSGVSKNSTGTTPKVTQKEVSGISLSHTAVPDPSLAITPTRFGVGTATVTVHNPVTNEDVEQDVLILTLTVDNPSTQSAQSIDFIFSFEAARKVGAAMIQCAP